MNAHLEAVQSRGDLPTAASELEHREPARGVSVEEGKMFVSLAGEAPNLSFEVACSLLLRSGDARMNVNPIGYILHL